jgi:hypothetical protein
MSCTLTGLDKHTRFIKSPKCFIVPAPGIDLIKLFQHKFTHEFCKLDKFKNANNICQNGASKLTPKSFTMLTPGSNSIKHS